MKSIWAIVDMSNQINNPWHRDTSLVVGQEKLRYAVKISGERKNLIKNFCNNQLIDTSKKKFIVSKSCEKKNKKYISRVVSLVHAYLLHHIIVENPSALTKIKVCRDTPGKFVDNYLVKISKMKNTFNLVNDKKIKYGVKEKNNIVQKYAKNVATGNFKPDYSVGVHETKEIIDMVSKFITKPK